MIRFILWISVFSEMSFLIFYFLSISIVYILYLANLWLANWIRLSIWFCCFLFLFFLWLFRFLFLLNLHNQNDLWRNFTRHSNHQTKLKEIVFIQIFLIFFHKFYHILGCIEKFICHLFLKIISSTPKDGEKKDKLC